MEEISENPSVPRSLVPRPASASLVPDEPFLEGRDSLLPLLESRERTYGRDSYRSTRRSLATAMGASLLLWFWAWIFFPLLGLPPRGDVKGSFWERFSTDSFGVTGPFLVLYGAPIVFIALLAPVYLKLSPARPMPSPRSSTWRYMFDRAFTFPALLRGPFGVLSAAELAAGVLFLLLLLWVFTVSLARQFRTGEMQPGEGHQQDMWLQHLCCAGASGLGQLALLCLAFVFIPLVKSSPLLRLVGISFEQGVRYHVCLCHLALLLGSFHAASCTALWARQRMLAPHERVRLWGEQLSCPGAAEVAGSRADVSGPVVLALALLIWATSLRPVRRRSFGLFLRTHQLFVLFLVALSVHAGDAATTLVLPGVLLYGVDRSLRFVQSCRQVGLLAARKLPGGTVELVIAKPLGLTYAPLCQLLLHVKSISSLLSPPVSVTSSALGARRHLSVLVPPSGSWACQLATAVEAGPTRGSWRGCPMPFTLSVEGPYGHTHDYYLQYDALIMVAGGPGGAAPFFSLLRDLFWRFRYRERPLPSDLTLIWTAPTAADLQLGANLSPAATCPEALQDFRLEILLFVTRQDAPASPPPSLTRRQSVPSTSSSLSSSAFAAPFWSSILPFLHGSEAIETLPGGQEGVRMPARAMLPLGDTFGCKLASLAVLLASVGGALFFMHLSAWLILRPLQGSESVCLVPPWRLRGALWLSAIALGVGIFGGVVLAAQFMWGRYSAEEVALEEAAALLELQERMTAGEGSAAPDDPAVTVYGRRPNLPEIFAAISGRLAEAQVGVLVNGPPGLHADVAEQCQQYKFAPTHTTTFHFHAVNSYLLH